MPENIYQRVLTKLKVLHFAVLTLCQQPRYSVKDLHHDHLVRFVGACVDPDMPYLLTEYCPRGSLQDILEDDDLQLDGNFKHSLIHDIVKVRS